MSALSELLTSANTESLTLDQITDTMRSRGHTIGRDTVWKYLRGTHPQPRREYLAAFADVFPSLTLRDLERAAAVPADLGNWTPPAEANALNHREREALEVMIRSMARGKTTGASVVQLRPAATHQDVDEAAMDIREGDTPPGTSEEPDT